MEREEIFATLKPLLDAVFGKEEYGIFFENKGPSFCEGVYQNFPTYEIGGKKVNEFFGEEVNSKLASFQKNGGSIFFNTSMPVSGLGITQLAVFCCIVMLWESVISLTYSEDIYRLKIDADMAILVERLAPGFLGLSRFGSKERWVNVTIVAETIAT